MIRPTPLALLAALALAPVARAGPSLRSPASIVEGEAAVFTTSDGRPAEVEVRRRGATVRATGEAVLEPGFYTVRLAGGRGWPRPLRVRALPPPVRPDAPLRERLATVQVHRWNNGETRTGQLLNGLGRTLGPLLVPRDYRFAWILAGTQTTRRNVRGAFDALARRGYVVDAFVAAHGYPIQLADGEWVPDHAGLAAVRLFYTTACYGARGQEEFRRAGVRTYVAAEGTNIVSAFHMAAFVRGWARGQTVAEASAAAWRFTHGAGDSFLLRGLARRAAGLPRGADLAAMWRDTKPHVFGDGSVRIVTPPAIEGPARAEAERLALRRRGVEDVLRGVVLGPVGALVP